MADDEILIIRHGALGDMIQSLGPIQAIRRHHPQARITLLTTPPFRSLAEACPWIDRVWLDARPGWRQPLAWLALRRQLRSGKFRRVYDLQTSGRSSFYLHLFPRHGRPEWSGIAIGGSHLHDNAHRDHMHTIDRQRDQLRGAGIDEVPAPDLAWLGGDIAGFDLPPDYALLVPGGSAHRPGKRWPAAHYAALCRLLDAGGVLPVLLGGPDEGGLATEIADAAAVPVRDLSGRTDFAAIASLARGARLAVGNDTGPMHIIATAGCPAVVLFSDQSDPRLCAPRGRAVRVLEQDRLAALEPARVWAEAEKLLRGDAPPAQARA